MNCEKQLGEFSNYNVGIFCHDMPVLFCKNMTKSMQKYAFPIISLQYIGMWTKRLQTMYYSLINHLIAVFKSICRNGIWFTIVIFKGHAGPCNGVTLQGHTVTFRGLWPKGHRLISTTAGIYCHGNVAQQNNMSMFDHIFSFPFSYLIFHHTGVNLTGFIFMGRCFT